MEINAPSLMSNLPKHAAKVEPTNYSAEFDKLYTRMDNFWKLYNDGQMSADVVRYLPGSAKAAHQEQIKSIETKRKYADGTYKDLKVTEFPIVLTKITTLHYTTINTLHLMFANFLLRKYIT